MKHYVDKTLDAASGDWCNWKNNPLSFITGETCGSYYKVLGLNPKDKNITKATIKEAYEKKFNQIHPNFNPSQFSDSAYSIIKNAYKCLSDDECRSSYDKNLRVKSKENERFLITRNEWKQIQDNKYEIFIILFLFGYI